MKIKIKKFFQMCGCVLLIITALFIILGSFKCFSKIPACAENHFFMFFENYAPQLITMSIVFSGVILILLRKIIAHSVNNLIFTEDLDADFTDFKSEINEKVKSMTEDVKNLKYGYNTIEERRKKINDRLRQLQKEHKNIKKYVVETNNNAEKHLKEILMYTDLGDNERLKAAREQKKQELLEALDRMYS